MMNRTTTDCSRMLPQSASLNRGFTTIELTLVLGIAGLLTSIAIPHIQNQRHQADIQITVDRMEIVNRSLNAYSEDHDGRFPTHSEGLKALDDSGIADTKLSKDAWGNEFLYISPGVMNHNTFDICSSGPDHVLGNADDITNW